MICATCGTENPAGAKFCIACASPLAVVCPNCGTANPPAARFCAECATPLTAAAVRPSPAAASPKAPAVAERRLVSVLFADLVGFTALAEGRDAEDTRELLSRYFEMARDVVKRYGGTVEKFIGDAVMAVWGAPTAHEDDAERAVRAGLELVDAVKALGPGVQARAGVLTGEAAVTIGATDQGMVAGDLVNTASRLQSVAPPGVVLVGEATQRAADKAIAFEAAGEQMLKGKTAPVPAWRALRVVAEVGGRNRADTLEAPFVGREDELRLLKDLFHATAREHRARLVSVIGPGGIGKTRLAWEFLKYVDGLVDTVWWHDGRSPAYGEGVSFWALGEMVRARAGLLEGDDEATTRAKIAATLAQHVPVADERRWIEPALLALLGVESDLGSEQLFGAWRTFFERLAASAPVVMVFEDFHYADPGLLAFVDHLLEWSKSAPIYVLTLSRPELVEHRPDWGAGKRNFVAMTLEPLAPPAMRELLDGLAPGLPASAVKAIVERADGIPLYAVETVRMLVAEGRLRLEGERYVPSGDLTSLAVPESLTALIAARLDGLDPLDRALVQEAAVLGQSFTLAGLAAVTGQDAGALEPRLRDLVRRELLVQQADARSPERGQYAFVQALIREVAYGTLAKADRKARHLAAARFFEGIGSEELAGALAGHYLAAYRNAPRGPEADALAGQARLALKGAADRAAGLGAHDQAVTLLDQAIRVATDDAERATLRLAAAANAESAAMWDATDAYLADVIAWARATETWPTLAVARTARARILVNQSQVEPGIAELTAAIGELGPHVADREMGMLQAQLARAYSLHDQSAAGVTAADAALALAGRAIDVATIADALVSKATGLALQGRTVESVALGRGALDLAVRHGLVAVELRARHNLTGYLFDDDPVLALELVRTGLELAERLGEGGWAYALTRVYATRAFWVGDWDEVLAVTEAALSRNPTNEVRIGLEAIRAWVLWGAAIERRPATRRPRPRATSRAPPTRPRPPTPWTICPPGRRSARVALARPTRRRCAPPTGRA